MPHEPGGIEDNFVDVDRIRAGHIPPTEHEKLPCELCRSLSGLLDLAHISMHLGIGFDRISKEACVADNHLQQVVEIVGNSPGQLTDGLHSLGLTEALLGLFLMDQSRVQIRIRDFELRYQNEGVVPPTRCNLEQTARTHGGQQAEQTQEPGQSPGETASQVGVRTDRDDDVTGRHHGSGVARQGSTRYQIIAGIGDDRECDLPAVSPGQLPGRLQGEVCRTRGPDIHSGIGAREQDT